MRTTKPKERRYVKVFFPLSLLGAYRCKLCFRGFGTLFDVKAHLLNAHRRGR